MKNTFRQRIYTNSSMFFINWFGKSGQLNYKYGKNSTNTGVSLISDRKRSQKWKESKPGLCSKDDFGMQVFSPVSFILFQV